MKAAETTDLSVSLFAPLREALSGSGALAAGLVVLVLITILVILRNVAAASGSGAKGLSARYRFMHADVRITEKVFRYLLVAFIACYFGYFYVRHFGLEAHVGGWLDLLLRWAHVVAGIAWIGTSFYFIFLENSLNRSTGLREGLEGNLWAIHGGGIYYLEKFKTAPSVVPEKLHWFKYEAYFTWLTGFALLWIVYYLHNDVYMVDPSVRQISSTTAVLTGIGAMLFSWFVYDALCKTLLPERRVWFAASLFLFLCLLAYLLCQVLSSRAAFIHIGAALGTLMAANVFFVIIPSQKSLVNAAREGKMPDAAAGKKPLSAPCITIISRFR